MLEAIKKINVRIRRIPFAFVLYRLIYQLQSVLYLCEADAVAKRHGTSRILYRSFNLRNWLACVSFPKPFSYTATLYNRRSEISWYGPQDTKSRKSIRFA